MRAILVTVCLVLAACGGAPKKIVKPSPARKAPVVSTKPQDSTAPLTPLSKRMLAIALKEWDFFGQQRVVYQSTEESIPHVGYWEDEDTHVARVNRYWQAVGLPGLDGKDCQQPWSAAFISWVMDTAGVPWEQFPPARAHWIYLAQIIRHAGEPDRYFVPHSIHEYSPKPGDLICAGREIHAIPYVNDPIEAAILENSKLHCDIVVERRGELLEAIGGNVRNSVSKSILTLDRKGYLQPTRRRPWFMVLENRR